MPNRKQLKGITFSATAPSSPARGDIWQETNAGGSNLYSFYWTWNGTYWLSPEKSWDASFHLEANSASVQHPLDLRFNYLVTYQTAMLFCDTIGTTSNFWYLAVYKVTGQGQTQFTLNFNTSNFAAATWRNQGIQTHNQFMNPSGEGLTGIRVFAIKNGAAGNFWGGSELFYQLARK
jgi:hypothetical protein